MRRGALVGIAAALLAPASLLAQSLEEKRDQKLAEPWVKHGGWITDYEAARAKAKEEGKILFTYFTRSYAP